MVQMDINRDIRDMAKIKTTLLEDDASVVVARSTPVKTQQNKAKKTHGVNSDQNTFDTGHFPSVR